MMRMRRLQVLALAAAAALGLSGCGFTGLYGAPLPGGADLGDHPYSLTMYFSDVLDLVPQSSVKINDVAVGKVDTIALTNCRTAPGAPQQWCARVKVEVNGSVHLAQNATAEVKQTSLLGEKYVSLQQPTGPKTTDAAGHVLLLKSGDTIKYRDTSSAPEVETVLGSLSLLLNDGGLQQIQTIASELNKALKGNEPDVRDLLGQLNTFVGTLDKQKDTITTALTQINTLAATLNKQKQILTNALDTYPQALQVLAGERKQLVTLLTSLSHLGRTVKSTLNASVREVGDDAQNVQAALVRSLVRLDPSVQALTKAGAALPNSLKIGLTFPFPLGQSRQFLQGDYANLALSLDLDLNNELCNNLNALGKSASALGSLCASLIGQGGSSTKLATSSASSSPAGTADSGPALQPAVITGR